MKNNLFVVLVFLTSISFYAQTPLYSDSFDEGVQNVMGSTNNSVSYENNRVKITGNGSGGDFEAMGYELHTSGTESSFDLSSNARLYFKARTTSNLTFRVDFKDANGFSSSQNGISTGVSGNEFTIYSLDFTATLTEAIYMGSPCTTTTEDCPVDKTQISEFVFFFNPGSGGFNGTMEIEWISVGEPLEALPPDEPELRYNQVSYFTGRDKIINIISQDDFAPFAYEVFNSSNEMVKSGTSSATALWNEANEYASVIDVSELNTEDTYRLVTDFDEITFQVNDEGYSQLRRDAFRYYYFNRASLEVTPELGGVYARPAGHPDTNILVHSSAATTERPEGFVIESPKGWYDAGDYNKYIVNSGISTYTLLAAYEHFEEYYKNLEFNIPEKGGNLPDILDEVVWNLDWMISMQDPNDGGVYHKLTAKGFSGIIMPNAYNLQRYVVQKSTAAALNLAAVAAQASRIFADYESVKPGYSAQLLQVAKDAYAWAKANPAIYYDQYAQNSPVADISTGNYGDNNVNDEFQWAAVELFITSGEEQYKNDINVSAIQGGTPYWGGVSPLALLSIAHYADVLTADINVAGAMNTFMSTANGLKDKVTDSPMRVAMGQGDYSWGSNGQAANQIMLLLKAFQYSEDESFLQAAYSGMDYLLGRNGTGYCFVSGFGDQPMMNPHHRISEADAVAAPVPGMLAGGPHAGAPVNDKCTGYPSNSSNATTYVDTWCSYASNEVTINWNAPLVYAVNALHFYENESILSVDEVSVNSDRFNVFPNPTQGELKIYASENLSGVSVRFYTIQGKTIYSAQLERDTKSVNIDHFLPGIYLMEVKIGDTIHMEKVVKE